MKKEVSFNIFDELSCFELRLFDTSLSKMGKEMCKYCEDGCSCSDCKISNLCLLFTVLSRDLHKRIDELCAEGE